MKIDDFLRRWAFHYANPDFLKIPMGQEESYSVLPINFYYTEYSLRQGGYGTYVTEYTPRRGSFKQDQNPVKECKGYLYQEIKNKDKTISYKVISPVKIVWRNSKRYYADNQYWIFDKDHLDDISSANAFAIPSYGNYYFLLQSPRTKSILPAELPARVYKITITKEFFEKNCINCSVPIPESKISYDINLFSYYNAWSGNRMLPNIYEEHEVEKIESREWYEDSNGTVPYLRDLVCCPCSTQKTDTIQQQYTCIKPKQQIQQELGGVSEQEIKVTPSSSLLTIAPKDYKYLIPRTDHSTITGQKFSEVWENFLAKNSITQITHHYTYEKSTATCYYKRHFVSYNLIDNSSVNIVDRYTDGGNKEYQIIDTENGDTEKAYADLTSVTINGLLIDDQIKRTTPNNRDQRFYGWYPSLCSNNPINDTASLNSNNWGSCGFIYDNKAYSGNFVYYKDLNNRTLKQGRPQYDYIGSIICGHYIEDGEDKYFFWSPAMINNSVKIGDLLPNWCCPPDASLNPFPSGFERYVTLNESFPTEYVIFPYISGYGASSEIFCCTSSITKDGYYDIELVDAMNTYSSDYWYQANDGYISLKNVDVFNYGDGPSNMTWGNRAFINPDSGVPDDYTTWTVQNTFTDKIKSWKGLIPPYPEGWLEMSYTYIRQVYDLLSPELQEHLGFGYQDFTIEALTVNLKEYGYETELDKLLNEIAAPINVL